ncbi:MULTISPECIES: aldo/keto reductase [unclassified Meridianimarinicoccus]|uniref:aldo/keto reductase n=1 Tax=unclassified Meridianimarinicoccus TaxID=2923344 RepID=UPI001866E11C|nr:aldo/keto reductase [Fluviibacterium sp. MJW13]
MKKNPLGRTETMVTDLCLGSMTWGTQTPETEAHTQIDMALDHGINFIDTAEAYPVNPMKAETAGLTEQVIGTWIAKSGRRDEVVLATKVAGAGSICHDGAPISSKLIDKALKDSLARLQTDHVDLYQLHWPNRGSYAFRQNWTFDPFGQDRARTVAHMEDTLAGLKKHVEAGRIRHVGLSNESAWGTMMWLEAAQSIGAPRMVSIQNEYSLLFRMFDTDLAEVAAHEQVGLLSYSPLACGMLTGKYRDGACPEGSRLAVGTNKLGGRFTDRAQEAVEIYAALASDHGLDLAHMSLAFCRARPFMTSTIFGATTVPQLEHILAGIEVSLPDEVLTAINDAHRAFPMPY